MNRQILSKVNSDWLEDFHRKNGRYPRVLHIGNIANNAYNNAKILNEAGFDSDVICYDYYHIMGCPEWEDADITGFWDDDFMPKWYKTNLKNFNRPKWFAQGPLKLCINYLIAKNNGYSLKQDVLWYKLNLFNGLAKPSFVYRAHLGSVLRIIIYRVFNKIIFTLRSTPNIFDSNANQQKSKWQIRLLKYLICFLLVNLLFILYPLFRLIQINKKIKNANNRYLENMQLKWGKKLSNNGYLVNDEDFFIYGEVIGEWDRLFQKYDIILAYSTDPIIPFLSGRPYFAFEHGTLRSIPFENNAQGRRTTISYHCAEHVFVTNFDCLGKAQKLAPGRVTSINHPFDEDHGFSVTSHVQMRDELLKQLNCDFLFFFPTRQDWVEGTGFADKANNLFIIALADMKRMGLKIGAVFCEWGSNVNESKRLISDLGLSSNALWIKPLPMVPFERMAMASDVVVDQFKIGSFGGVMFKSMALGVPVLTYIDEAKLLDQYPELPPVINCSSKDAIVTNALALYHDREKLSDLSERSRKWIKKFHGKKDTVNLQIDQFRNFYKKHKFHR